MNGTDQYVPGYSLCYSHKTLPSKTKAEVPHRIFLLPNEYQQYNPKD